MKLGPQIEINVTSLFASGNFHRINNTKIFIEKYRQVLRMSLPTSQIHEELIQKNNELYWFVA